MISCLYKNEYRLCESSRFSTPLKLSKIFNFSSWFAFGCVKVLDKCTSNKLSCMPDIKCLHLQIQTALVYTINCLDTWNYNVIGSKQYSQTALNIISSDNIYPLIQVIHCNNVHFIDINVKHVREWRQNV